MSLPDFFGTLSRSVAMTILAKILTGAAGLAMVAGGAAPAAAQPYPPPQPYPYGGYGNQPGTVGGVINQVLGGGAYGQYGQGNDRVAVDQCARAAQARVSRSYNQGYYNQGYGNQGYGNQGYGYNNAGVARVVGITNVERKSYGLKVYGLIASGRVYPNTYGNQGYGQPGYGNQGYAYNNQVADLRFSCKVDYRGYVSDIDIKRNNQAYRGY